MTQEYNSSRSDLLKRIGLSPSKRLLVFLISTVLITIPFGYAYNSVAIILFVLYSLLSAKKEDFSLKLWLLLPLLLFTLMVASLLWSIDFKSSLKAISKEAALLFIPIAFCFNKYLIQKGSQKILKNFSVAMCLFGIYFLGRAFVHYQESGNATVFLYNELATPVVTAVYLSALFSIAFFYFLSLGKKKFLDYIALIFIAILIALLLVKVVIVADVLLTAVYFVFFSNFSKKARIILSVLFIMIIGSFVYYAKTNSSLPAEYTSNIPEMEALAKEGIPVNNITINEAWNKPVFDENDYFNGTAFRVYQIRIFTELLQEDKIFFTGYGLNASLQKIKNKAKEHNVFEGGILNHRYSRQNFHNQYIEVFADLGIIGFLILITALFINLKNALIYKDFSHIAFAILMIALLLTESFLWRQRGVVLFTVLYCLFNIRLPKITEKEKHEKNTHNRSSRISGVASL